MPFTTDVTWPDDLHTIFKVCRPELQLLETRYFGPYDKLFNYCFGDSFHYFVALQKPLGDLTARDTAPENSIMFFVVYNIDRRPVLFAQIEDDAWARAAHLRVEADQHIRDGYNYMLVECPVPRLWGLSLLGTSVRVYRGDVATYNFEPPYLSRPNRDYFLPRDFLEGEWNMDILSQEGFDKMKEIVQDIVQDIVTSSERV